MRILRSCVQGVFIFIRIVMSQSSPRFNCIRYKFLVMVRKFSDVVCFFKGRIRFIFITKFPVKDSIVRNIIMYQRSAILCRCLGIYYRIKNFIIYLNKS